MCLPRLQFAWTVLVLGAAACSSETQAPGGSRPALARADAGKGLLAFTPPRDPGGGGVLFTASGEVLALTGYAFPPAQPGDTAFVDGWDVNFTRLLVTLDKLRLSENPDAVPGNQAADRQARGGASTDPGRVDLAHDDPSYLPGKGGARRARSAHRRALVAEPERRRAPSRRTARGTRSASTSCAPRPTSRRST